MKNRVMLASVWALMFPLAAQWSSSGIAGEARNKGDQSLEALSLVLELTPDQIKQASEIFKTAETAKQPLRSKLREKFGRLNEVIRSDAPKEAEIKVLCREIAGLQEQLVYRNTQTQVAFRKILDGHQIERLNRLEQLDSGVSGLGYWHRRGGKDD